MPVPAFLIGLGLTEAVWLAVLGIVRLISWLTGIVLVSSYFRDAITKVTEEKVEETRSDVVEDILSDPTLTPEQKEAMIRQYLDLAKPGFFDELDTGKIVLIAAVILGAAYVLRGRS